MVIESARSVDSIQIARLHYSAIDTGFLSSLGSGFLNSLYKYLISKEIVLVCREGEMVLGFVSFSYNSGMMIKKFLFYPAGVVSFLLAILKRPSLVFSAIETFRIPFKNKSAGEKKLAIDLPEAELLSISVDPGTQKAGIGTLLLSGLEKRLSEEGVKEYKVVAGANLIAANRFYQKNGFHLATQINIHRKELSNVYCKSLS